MTSLFIARTKDLLKRQAPLVMCSDIIKLQQFKPNPQSSYNPFQTLYTVTSLTH